MTPRLQLTNAQIEKMKAEFLRLDVDGDGTISKDELKKGMKRIGHLHDKKTIKTMMKDADTQKT